MNQIHIAELDCVFISYDEPNAEAHWTDLLDKCMWAKRVHGVKGSDACHKAAAMQSDTEWFITVDADNIVDTKFFDQIIDIPTGAKAFSWPGVNFMNGLRYGNGSLKVWRKDFVLEMKSHEAADKAQGAVDFCWEDSYRPMVESYSTTYPNGSPFQAWRAGFREGVKMSLVDGIKLDKPSTDKLHWHNLHRLKVWCSVGSHVENGLWAIYGARLGTWMTNCTEWNYVDVRDFEILRGIWNQYGRPYEEVNGEGLVEAIKDLGEKLHKELNLRLTLLDSPTSDFVVGTFAEQYQQALEQTKWTMGRNRV